MIIYLNERSLEKHANWGAGLRLFWEVAIDLSRHADLFKDSHFFLGAEFKQRFNSALAGAPQELRPRLREIAFSERYWKCWRPLKVSTAGDQFVCQDPMVLIQDESICEAAALKQCKGELVVGVVSTADSAFANKPLLRLTNQATQSPVELRNADSAGSARQWIAQERGYYDPTSRVAPADFQTILVKDATRFRRTGRVRNVAGKDRRIYLEVNSGNQFYVDEGHPGHSAHLEVFDSNGRHLGEADIESGNLDPQKKDPSKTINM
jgi:hypothetical protein